MLTELLQSWPNLTALDEEPVPEVDRKPISSIPALIGANPYSKAMQQLCAQLHDAMPEIIENAVQVRVDRNVITTEVSQHIEHFLKKAVLGDLARSIHLSEERSARAQTVQ